jgi:hypothetical protein
VEVTRGGAKGEREEREAGRGREGKMVDGAREDDTLSTEHRSRRFYRVYGHVSPVCR